VTGATRRTVDGRRDAQLAGGLLFPLGQRPHRRRELTQQRRDALVQGEAGGRGRDLARRAEEELHPEVGLEPRHGPAHRGLGEPQLAGRGRERRGPRDRLEDREQVEVHRAVTGTQKCASVHCATAGTGADLFA
jgi:hypothetical protein